MASGQESKISYIIIDEGDNAWRRRKLDALTIQSAADGYVDIYRINGDAVDKLDPDGTWSPVEWDEESVEEDESSIQLSDEQ